MTVSLSAAPEADDVLAIASGDALASGSADFESCGACQSKFWATNEKISNMNANEYKTEDRIKIVGVAKCGL